MRLISPEMLDKARASVRALAVPNVEFAEGRAEAIPAAYDSLDAVLATLILMSVIKVRAYGARDISRSAASWALYRLGLGWARENGYRPVPTDRR